MEYRELYQNKIQEIFLQLNITNSPTQKGFKEEEIELVAAWICDILDDIGNGKLTNKIAEQVKELCSSFPVYK